MAILVFGGAGFIGTHLLESIKRNDNGVIYAVDLHAPKRPISGVNYIKHDVRDLSGLSFAEPIERIYNLAAVHQTPGHETAEYYETNIAGAVEVTAFARRFHICEIIFTSSISIYGPSEESKTEASTPNPQSAYGASKLLAEQVHRRWAEEESARRLVIVRPAVVFGHGEGGNFTRLARFLSKGFFVYPGRKDTIKACIYVEDLITAIEHARGVRDRVVTFNGCYPDRYTIEQIVETFRHPYFPHVKTFLLPLPMMMILARFLYLTRWARIGIHPERILKLVRSTDILPTWLETHGFEHGNALPHALKRWADASQNRFD